MKATAIFAAISSSLVLVSGCIFGGGNNDRTPQSIVEDIAGGANPYLWRASLDTLSSLPLVDADPFGGTIIYDWASYEDIPGERIKATVYILDSRLRADGVKVSVFRQTQESGEWTDAAVDPATGIQLENAILNRARNLRASDVD
ncbi:MAG: DUF3576 domain-containing protein [Pseudomonadota bacterium]